VIQVWESTEKRGRGQPPTTGEYRQIAEAKKAVNDEEERELYLAMKARTLTMEETLAILRKAHLDPEDVVEKAMLNPTPDIASKGKRRRKSSAFPKSVTIFRVLFKGHCGCLLP